MKVRLGALRKFLHEALDNVDRLGESDDLDETDLRMMGDDKGPGDGELDGEKMADHLRGNEEKRALGDPPSETMGEALLRRELKKFFMQEGPAGASGSDPREPRGSYSTFDMARDHGDAEGLSSPWYKSPGRPAGEDGDPYRSADPYSQLGFHPPKAGADPTASPPGAGGEQGTQARLAPPIWQLSAGSDTSSVLGANAHPASSEVGSDGEQEEGEGSTGLESGDTDEEGEAQGGQQDQGRPQRGRV